MRPASSESAVDQNCRGLQRKYEEARVGKGSECCAQTEIRSLRERGSPLRDTRLPVGPDLEELQAQVRVVAMVVVGVPRQHLTAQTVPFQ